MKDARELELAKLQWRIDEATEKIKQLETKLDCLDLKVDKIDEKVTVVDKKIDKVENKVEDTAKAIVPITKFVYGLIGLILVTFFFLSFIFTVKYLS